MEDVLERLHPPVRPAAARRSAWTRPASSSSADARPPTAAEPGPAGAVDYEYERRGTANLFLWCEPLRGRRHVAVTERRTKVDWAHAIKDLVDVHYPDAERIVLVLDNLNTHTPGSLYEAFPPAEAKRLADKLEIHYTPKHGSWLNIAEIELSVLARPVPGPPHPGPRDARTRGGGLGGGAERPRRHGRLALHDRRRPHQAEASLPVNRRLTGY